MADSKIAISQLNEVAALAQAAVLPLVQEGVTQRVSVAAIRAGLAAAEALTSLEVSLAAMVQELNNGKVDKEMGKGLSTHDFSTALRDKLAGIAPGANNYTHPEQHPPNVLMQDAQHRLVSDTEKAYWGGKAEGVHGHPMSSIDGLVAALASKVSAGDDVSTINGRSAEMRATETHVQWRLVGDPIWIDLYQIPTGSPSQPSFPAGQYGIFSLQSAPDGSALFTLQ